MGFDIEGVRLCAIEADLVTPLIKPAIALQHRVMPVRCFVVQPTRCTPPAPAAAHARE
jgi:hypothetical protein